MTSRAIANSITSAPNPGRLSSVSPLPFAPSPASAESLELGPVSSFRHRHWRHVPPRQSPYVPAVSNAYVAFIVAVPFDGTSTETLSTTAVDDDDVSITGHDPNTGLPIVLVESDALTARAWLDADLSTAIRDDRRAAGGWFGLLFSPSSTVQKRRRAPCRLSLGTGEYRAIVRVINSVSRYSI